MSRPDHLNLLLVGHACLLEILAEVAINQANGREVLYAAKANFLQLLQEIGHDPEWIRTTYSGQNRRVLHDGKDFVGLR